MHWIIFLLLTSYAGTVHSQTWAGMFNIDSSCAAATCCCLSNQIVITRPSTNTIAFNASLAGSFCMGMTSYSGSGAYPSGYSISQQISVITITITLNSNSTVLTIGNTLGASCTSYAIRVGDVPVTTTMPAVIMTTTPRNGTASANQKVNLALLAGFVTFNMIMRN